MSAPVPYHEYRCTRCGRKGNIVNARSSFATERRDFACDTCKADTSHEYAGTLQIVDMRAGASG